ncbi:ABC transporter ATP-binding protein [Verrucomicrobiaceae bacterium R5-34]|nr:ABC transporter ATP-binding protein [Verrucomicrobiaceae bacterium R5-34]
MPALDIHQLSLTIGAQRLLTEVSCSIRSGERVAIVGANGAGKTSLLRCLLGLINPDQGEVRIQGETTTSLTRAQIAQKIAYVPQGLGGDIPFSVQDFILMSRYSHAAIGPGILPHDHDGRQIAKDMMQRAGVDHLAQRSLNTLSGGERQKVNIAAALTQQSPILLLDEPAAHLDPKQRESIQELLGDIGQGEKRTIVSVTHDLNWAAMDFDRIIGMKNGEVLHDATPNDFITTETLEEIFDSRWSVQPHPESGAPMVVPRHHRHPSHD